MLAHPAFGCWQVDLTERDVFLLAVAFGAAILDDVAAHLVPEHDLVRAVPEDEVNVGRGLRGGSRGVLHRLPLILSMQGESGDGDPGEESCDPVAKLHRAIKRCGGYTCNVQRRTIAG